MGNDKAVVDAIFEELFLTIYLDIKNYWAQSHLRVVMLIIKRVI